MSNFKILKLNNEEAFILRALLLDGEHELNRVYKEELDKNVDELKINRIKVKLLTILNIREQLKQHEQEN